MLRAVHVELRFAAAMQYDVPTLMHACSTSEHARGMQARSQGAAECSALRAVGTSQQVLSLQIFFVVVQMIGLGGCNTRAGDLVWQQLTCYLLAPRPCTRLRLQAHICSLQDCEAAAAGMTQGSRHVLENVSWLHRGFTSQWWATARANVLPLMSMKEAHPVACIL